MSRFEEFLKRYNQQQTVPSVPQSKPSATIPPEQSPPQMPQPTRFERFAQKYNLNIQVPAPEKKQPSVYAQLAEQLKHQPPASAMPNPQPGIPSAAPKMEIPRISSTPDVRKSAAIALSTGAAKQIPTANGGLQRVEEKPINLDRATYNRFSTEFSQPIQQLASSLLTTQTNGGFTSEREIRKWQEAADQIQKLIDGRRNEYQGNADALMALQKYSETMSELFAYSRGQQIPFVLRRGVRAGNLLRENPNREDADELKKTYYTSLFYRPDFEESSKFNHIESIPYATYEQSENPEEYDKLVPWDFSNPNSTVYPDAAKLIYEAVNGNWAAAAKLADIGYVNDPVFGKLGGSYSTQTFWGMFDYMSDDERNIFNYVCNTGGINEGIKFLNYIGESLTDRTSKGYQSKIARYAQQHPWQANIERFAIKPVNDIFNLVPTVMDSLDGKMDPLAKHTLDSVKNSTIISTTADNIDNDIGKWAYQAGTGILDSVNRKALSFGNPIVSDAMAASGALTDSMLEAEARGLEGWRATAYAYICAAAEVGAEHIQFDKLFMNENLTKKTVVKYLLENMATEGLEEMTTEGITYLADALISQDKSQWQMAVNAYKEEGKSDSEAWLAAIMDQSAVMLQSGVTGAISGGVMSGGTAGFTYLSGSMPDAPATMPKVQSAVQTEYSKRLLNAKVGQESLSAAEQMAIYNEVVEDLAAGKLEGYEMSGEEMAQVHNSYQQYLNAHKDAVNAIPTVPPTDAKSDTPATSSPTTDTATPTPETGAAATPSTADPHFSPAGPINMDDVIDESMAQLTGAPADPVAAALDTVKAGGTVSNNQARDILNNLRAIRYLQEKTGMKLIDDRSGGTASSRRAAVKEAIAQLAAMETETVDTAPSSDTSGIKAQLRNSQDTLNAMDSVADIQAPDNFSDLDIAQKKDWVIEKLRPTGYKVERKGFGLISFAKKQLKAAFNYFKKGSVEELTFEAVPYVLERGVEISSHPDHKGREYGTVTIAAPVTVNGKRGNMAVVVKQTSGNTYKVHRIISPDGSVFDLSETKSEAELTPTGEAPETGSLATSKSSASDNSIPDSGEIVNPTTSVGAAPGWFDLNTRLQYEHGTIPEGENPVRPADLPKRDYTGKDVSKTAATVKGAKVTPDEFVDLLNKETVEGGLSYVRISNDAATQKATEYITEHGWELAKALWENDVVDGKAGAVMDATGALLLNNAASAGDHSAWRDILFHYQMLGTNTAQGMQALRILKTLEPSDKLYMIKRSVQQMSKDTGLDLTIAPELVNEFDSADTDKGRDDAIDKIKQDIADQIPSTFMEKWNALRYVNMLGNLKTQGRNILGNLSMKALNATKNAVAVVLENIAYKVSGGKFERTKSLAVSKELLSAAKADFAQLQSVIMGGGKMGATLDQGSQFAQDVQDKRRILGVKGDKWYQKAANAALAPLEGYRKVTNWAMEKGDLVFSRSAYARSLAGYLKAHGVTDSDLSKVDTELMDKARLYAVKEAQEVTFRDSNRLSDWISKIGRRKNTHPVGKVLAEGAAPFRKTPANVLLRAEEYSPLGIINSVGTSIKAMQKGSDITGAQVINSWSKTLTGTGIFLLGMLLNNLGVLTAGPDEDDDKEAAESMNGQQNYALTIPGTDINITIDVFSSVAMPMLMGAELMEICNSEGFELKDLESSLMSIADPMIQMSMLQGVDDILTDIKYSDGPIGRLVETVAVNYLMQGMTNSLLGQLERGTEDVRMTTYTDENSPIPKWLQYQLGKASAKTPGWDYHQTPYINAKGEEEKNPDTLQNLLYNTLSPVYIEQNTSTDMDKELDRLNDAQSNYNVYLRKPSKSLTADGEEIHLSADQYDTLCRVQGQHQVRLVEDIMNLEEYEGLTDDQKAKLISEAYDYARELSKSSIDIDGKIPAYIRDRPDGMSEAEAILRQTVAGTTTKYTDVPIDTAAFVAELMEGLQIAPRETDADGKPYTNVRPIQKMEAVVESDELDAYVEKLLPMYMRQSTRQRYQTALDEGYTSDEFVAAYRLYLDRDKELSKTRQIKELAEELDMDYRTAKTLWEIYSEKPD